MTIYSFSSLQNSLRNALNQLPDFNRLNPFEKGKVIDQTFKGVLLDLMKQFGMKPGIDYVDNLRDNEPAADFVALSKEADDLITGLMEGKIIPISGHCRISKNGRSYDIKPHFRRIAV